MTDNHRPAQVFVVGSLNADHRVHVARIPQPGETVPASDIVIAAGGKGANQAVAAARAGATTTIIGAIGDDGDAAIVERALGEQEIDSRHVRRIPEAPTGRALITVDIRGENTIVVSPGANEKLTSDDIDDGLSDVKAGDLILLQLETPGPLVRYAAGLARDAGGVVLLNPTPVPDSVDDLFDNVDMLIVNEHEFARVAGLLDIANDVGPEAREAAMTMLAKQAEVTVVCTAGSEGAFVTQRERVEHITTSPVEAVDTTAAGDTFIGYLAAHLAITPGDVLGAIRSRRPRSRSHRDKARRHRLDPVSQRTRK